MGAWRRALVYFLRRLCGAATCELRVISRRARGREGEALSTYCAVNRTRTVCVRGEDCSQCGAFLVRVSDTKQFWHSTFRHRGHGITDVTMGCGHRHTENARAAEDTGLSTVLHSKPVVGVLIVTPHPEAVRIALQAASAAAPACSLLLGRSARGIATSAHPRQQAICKGQTRPPGCEPHRASTHQHWCRTPTEWAAARPALVASSTEAVARYIHPV